VQRAPRAGSERGSQNFYALPLPASDRFRRVVALGAAVAALAVAASPGSAAASPSGECREVACTGSAGVGRTAVTWTSPQVFYPNNEEVFAAPVVGTLTLSEVRVYGPALCRHRFVGASMTVVIKACGAQTPLRVRAWRRKPGTRSLAITYAARPILGDPGPAPAAAPPPAGTIFDELRQITGLLLG
jgi:hypothetical protein